MLLSVLQVYAACGQHYNGSIRVMQADQTVEVLYESEADYPGISSIWSLTPWPGADCHSLVVLSFASNSRAMATGTMHAGSLHCWLCCVVNTHLVCKASAFSSLCKLSTHIQCTLC